MATDGNVAIVVDPQRDIDRLLAVTDAVGATVVLVVETHIHNDYVSGGLALARATGAQYALCGDDQVAFGSHRTPLRDGDELVAGSMRLRAVATPGHTPTHLSYVLTNDDSGALIGVFTGGSMLFGAAGRTDLMGGDQTLALTAAQWRSIRRLAETLDDGVEVHPTHGFGSFCSAAAPRASAESTVADERLSNPALLLDLDEFTELLLAGLVPYPAYYVHMASRNREGAPPVDLSPPFDIDVADLPHHLENGGWVVDLRPRGAYAAAHLPGTVGVELSDPFATYLGWTMPWGTPVTLFAPDAVAITEAQRALARIGIDRPAAAVVGPVDAHLARSYPVASFAELALFWPDGQSRMVLDVRRPDEWRAGHLEGAAHVPLYELVQRRDELPTGVELWVHCASGFRASIAASLVDDGKRTVVLIDDDFTSTRSIGLPVTGGR
ncbi:MAG: MBL fold metallo-hydrolase [Acidimicrobiia bacterium]|nr:MBL fold metallo-hydrolase [Acidimicrobiia bacterium]